MNVNLDTNLVTLLAILIAGIVTICSQPGRLTTWEMILGLILSSLLFHIDSTAFHTVPIKLSFWAIAGLCWTITIGWIVEWILDMWPCFDVPECEDESENRHYAFLGVWLLLSFVAFLLLPVGKTL